MFKNGDKVKKNSKYFVKEADRDKVYTVRSAPWMCCGTLVIKLEGVAGGYAVDGLDLVEKFPEPPKPKIQTWKDWQRETFPNADAIIEPCMFASREELGCDGNCRGCCLQPIPYKYITKLGIEQ